MGRLEKQIIIGALALVGVLLTVVVLKGLKPRDGGPSNSSAVNGWDTNTPGGNERPGLIVDSTKMGEAGESKVVDLGPTPPPFHENRNDSSTGTQVPAVVKNASFPPPAPDITEEPDDAPWVYTVKRGEILGRIIQRELGSVRHQDAVLALNPTLNPDSIGEGDEILMPALSTLQSKPRSRTATERPEGVNTHVVAPNDSLWNLSLKYYGSTSGMDKIVAANKGLLDSKDTVLKIGWELTIPK